MLQLRAVGRCGEPAELAAELDDALRGLATLEDVVRRRVLALLEVVVQDEFTHDVVVACGLRFLVFDAT